MLVLITYDVATTSPNGQARLRKVAKTCERYGQRVQNSVFECYIDQTKYTIVKKELTNLINQDVDSLRFYQLGNSHKHKVEHIGVTHGYDMEDPLIF